jgi:hypothetical protein
MAPQDEVRDVQQPQDSRAEIEAQASAQGWRPKDQFTGDPESWVDADEYVKRGDPRYLREKLAETERMTRLLQQRQAESERRLAEKQREFEATAYRLERMSEITAQRLLRAQLANIEAQKRAAVDLGDAASYDQWSQAEQQLYRENQQVREDVARSAQQQQQKYAEEESPEVAQFRQRNPWFDRDQVLNLEAQKEHMRLNREAPYMPLEENLRQVEAHVKRTYPHLFGASPQPQAPAPSSVAQQRPVVPDVQGGGRMANGTSGQYAKRLNATERAQAQRDVQRGLYKNVEEWAQFYYQS